MNDTDIFAIIWWQGDNGIHYRCRGIGESYRQFYNEWIPNSSYRCTSSDFPWDYFVFDDHSDHERLINDFPNNVMYES